MDASTLLGAVPVGLQLWHAREAGGPELRWSNASAGEALRPLGAQAATAALAGEDVDGFAAVEGAGWFRVRARPLGDGGVVVSFEDETETHEILEGLQEGLLVVDLSERVARANEVAARLCAISLGELVGARLDDLPEGVREPVRRALGGAPETGVLARVARRDGTVRAVEVAARLLTEPDGEPYGVLGTYVDVTGREERERRAREEADTDQLTGLANRRALRRVLGSALVRAAARGTAVGVLLLDLDGFKAINDRFGHAAGDAALREVAARLRSSVRDRDLVARTGGDEFVIVLPDLAAAASPASEAADRVEAAFARPLNLRGSSPRLRAAVGVACFPADGGDVDALLAAADRAMYSRKR